MVVGIPNKWKFFSKTLPAQRQQYKLRHQTAHHSLFIFFEISKRLGLLILNIFHTFL